MWKIILLSLIPGIILTIQNGIYLHNSFEYLKGRHLMKGNVALSLEIGDVIHMMQKERGVYTLYVSVNGGSTLEAKISDAFNNTDRMFENLSGWMYSSDASKPATKQIYHNDLQNFRSRRNNVTFIEVADYYIREINVLCIWMIDIVKEEKNSDIWADLVAYHMLIYGKENVGIERALGAYFFSRGDMDVNLLLKYKGHHEQAEHYLNQVREYSSVATRLFRTYMDNDTSTIVHRLREEVIANEADTFSTAKGIMWFDTMTSYINMLHDVQRAMADYIKVKTDEEIDMQQVTVSVDVSLLVITFIVAVMVTLAIYKISINIQRVKNHLQEKTIHLEKEQQRTETLLTQLVPKKIAKRMTADLVEPELFESVTIMFADISNMDKFINRCTPSELLEMINDVFDVTEISLAKHNVTKITSTGNMLMAASGLHQKNSRYHSDEIANLSIDVMDKVQQIQIKSAFNEPVKLKIGVSIGSVVAGVVGGKLPKYCLFGESVIEAFQLMDTCLPSCIQLSESVVKNLATKMFITRVRNDVCRKTASSSKKTYWLCSSVTNAVTNIDLDVQNITDTTDMTNV